MGLDKDMFNFTSSSQNDCSIIDVFIVLQILDHIAKHCYLIVYICMMPLHQRQMLMYFFVIFGSMITPLMYCSDFRPYFTIHDSEFKEYTTKAHAPPPVILGVTNPFFAKTLQHWPHIIRICDAPHLRKFVKYLMCIIPFLCAIF